MNSFEKAAAGWMLEEILADLKESYGESSIDLWRQERLGEWPPPERCQVTRAHPQGDDGDRCPNEGTVEITNERTGEKGLFCTDCAPGVRYTIARGTIEPPPREMYRPPRIAPRGGWQ